MDTKNIKRIVAREGLIVLGIISSSLIYYYIRDLIFNLNHHDIFSEIPMDQTYALIFASKLIVLYFLIRFIIWAVKTLREK